MRFIELKTIEFGPPIRYLSFRLGRWEFTVAHEEKVK